MKGVLLVPSPHVHRQELEPYLPLGLFSLEAVATRLGVEVDVLDLWANTRGRSFSDSGELAEEVLASIDLSRYDVVGLSSTCSTFHHSLILAQRIKARAPRVSVWMGGPHASVLSAEILHASEAVDAVFVGESELTFSEALGRRCRRVKDLTGIAGLHTREGGYVPRSLLRDLDDLPFIAEAKGFRAALRRAKPYHFPDAVPLEGARGCIVHCTFCSTRQFWGGRVRRKSDLRLVAELRHMHGATGSTYFNLMGDNFGSPRHRLLGFCRTMADEAGAFRWVCNLRLDRIRPTDLDALWQGGCRGFFVGVESASQDTLDRVGKCVVLKDELEVIHRAIAMGFRVETSFIIGFPWETKKDLNRTFALHCRLLKQGVFRSAVWILCPLPGTRLAQSSSVRVSLDRESSGIARDDLPLDDAAVDLIRGHPRLFTQLGFCEAPHLKWADLIAVADASAQLTSAYAERWTSVPPPA